jgi:hypothetical protein
MGYIAEQIHRAAAQGGGVGLSPLDTLEASRLRSKLEDRYSPTNQRWPIWDTPGFPVGIHEPDGWAAVREFVGNRRCVLLFNPGDEPEMFRVANGAELDVLLRETSGFEFYVSDDEASYLLCFNHHDVLIGTGTALEWLRARAHPKGDK